MLEIDNRLCLQLLDNDHCFPDAQSAADYLGALSAVERLDFPYPLWAARGEPGCQVAGWRWGSHGEGWAVAEVLHFLPAGEPLEPLEPSVPLLPLLAASAVFVLVVLVLVVMVARRKREHSTLWFPEGFALHKDTAAGHKGRREPVGQDALGMK